MSSDRPRGARPTPYVSPIGRPTTRSALVFVASVALGLSLGETSWAGACQDQTRIYCVTGTSTVTDWSWQVDSSSSTVDASAVGLLPNDPATIIVEKFVDDLNAVGFPDISAAIITFAPQCFTIDSCTQLTVNGTLVDGISTVTFNPVIQQLPEPSSTAMLVVGILGLELIARHRRRARRACGAARGGGRSER